MTLAESQRACRDLTRATARNFGMTFLVLPRDMARDMETLYAFMRHTDDLSDRDVSVEERRTDLANWRTSFRDALRGQVLNDPYLPAAAELIHRRELKADYFETVIDGCEQDLLAVEIATRSELEAYCYQVAGAVGLCCVGIWGTSPAVNAANPDVAAEIRRLAIQTGFAFQLTNIIRDIREDAELGRRYLPQEDLQNAGCDEELLRSHRTGPPSGALRELLRYEVDQSRAAYAESERLSGLLSRPGRRVLTVMRLIYGGLLDEIERREFDVFSRRVSLTKRQKLLALGRGFLA